MLRVAVPVPLPSLFDYRPPPGVTPEALRPGVRLRVPFGKLSRTGILVGIATQSELPEASLKPAFGLIDDSPLLAAEELDFWLWAGGYYHHPVGEVFAGAMPSLLRRGRQTRELSPGVFRLTAAAGAVRASDLVRAPRQACLLSALEGAPQGLGRADLREACGDCAAALRALISKGWVELAGVPGPSANDSAEPRVEAITLNPDQETAVGQVAASLDQFGAFLLEGVTGSGKTEVYLRLMRQVLATGRQVLFLVPEIGLTPQLLRRLRERLRVGFAVLHSGLPDGERARAWLEARDGRADIVVGTRSAVFTPLPRLGLIVVDEEHDISFKQQEGFRYHARDLAVWRARQRSCPVVLGSATPSLETLQNAALGRYTRVCLPRRAGEARSPRFDLVDIRSQPLRAGLSPVLQEMLRGQLQEGNQVLLFLNRRGYAPVVTCHDCGWVSACPHCDARLTLHEHAHRLWCHHCGFQRRTYRTCPDCGRADLRPLGRGTERLEAELGALYPGVPIVRIDRDSTRRRGELERLVSAARCGDYRILIGTQMLAKGHHFPDLTLVGILDLDQGLFGADFRASERMAQVLTQVAGRAGRAGKPGRVLLQTRHPEHPLLHTLVRQGYGAFAAAALEERRQAGLPPFASQALIRAEAPEEGPASEFLLQAKAAALDLDAEGVELWGPVPAPMERRAGRHRAHLLAQACARADLQNLLELWVPRLYRLPGARRVRWSLDVDPQEVL